MWGIILSAVGWLVSAVVTVAEQVWAFFVFIWPTLLAVFRPILDGVTFIWNNVLKPFWAWAQDVLAGLRDVWTKFVRPIIDQVEQIIQHVKSIWNAVVQPIFDTISAVKEFLTLTHLDRTAFGQAIDDTLNLIERDINALTSKVFAPLNAILKFLNDIVIDVDGFFRYAMMVGSIGKSINTIAHQWWHAQLKNMKAVRQPFQPLKLKPSGNAAESIAGLVKALRGEGSHLTELHDRATKGVALIASGDDQGFDDWGRTAQPSLGHKFP
jgi:hypothetical protein